MALTRRTLLQIAIGAPVGAMSGACCLSSYPKPKGEARIASNLMPAILAPEARARAAISLGPVIDVHAHFFNASDVPVRGFLAECLGHRAPPSVQLLLKALARIADRLADLAPTAGDELEALSSLAGEAEGAAAPQDVVGARLEGERQAAAERVASAIRGSDFQRHYRRMKQAQAPGAAPARTGPLSPDEIRQVVSDAERPSTPAALGFLNYMLSPRWVNLRSYMKAFTTDENAFGVDKVLGALVDFDYWLDCPPSSAHDDQVRLHQRLHELTARTSVDGRTTSYFHPVVAYNPWTDINQDGAALTRVVDACSKRNFVAVKIYPPTGFRPAGNASIPDETTKRRPDLKKLDATLKAFFAKCADLRIPILAHSARSNGRDNAHDEFGGPKGWEALLGQYARATETQIIDFGHFGGGRGSTWTHDFAYLVSRQPQMSLYADLGYWEELMCPDTSDEVCTSARERLKQAMKVQIPGSSETVLDRTMFASDWLMLSQVKEWATYPSRLHDSLRTILDGNDTDVAKVFGGNAKKCFRL
jgi:predicted TIM-barrel fold metal-dependent hydrolase